MSVICVLRKFSYSNNKLAFGDRQFANYNTHKFFKKYLFNLSILLFNVWGNGISP